jgi:MFS family permease
MSDKVGLRMTVLISLLFNIVGNIIYSFGLYTGTNLEDPNYSSVGTYQMLIIGRLIAGVGSASLGLGVVYFTKTTSIEDRLDSVGIYRISQVPYFCAAAFSSLR